MNIQQLSVKIKNEIHFLLKESQLHLFPKIENEINTYLIQSEEKITKWQLLYAEGVLNLEEIEWLLESQKELISFEILKNIGLNQIKASHITNNVLKIILKAIIRV